MARIPEMPGLTDRLDSTLLRIPAILTDMVATGFRLPLLGAQLMTTFIEVPMILAQMATASMSHASERLDKMVEQNVRARQLYAKGNTDGQVAERFGDALGGSRSSSSSEAYAASKPLVSRPAGREPAAS